MQVVQCSDFLGQQEARLRNISAHWRTATAPSRGLWARIVGWLTGETMREASERQALANAADAEAEMWAQGREGEDDLSSELASHLDDSWTLLRNYTPPAPWDNGGDIDAVLLGPAGVIVFEVKAWQGNFRVTAQGWEYAPFPGARWSPAFSNPNAQAHRNAQRMRAMLDSRGFHRVPLRPAIAVTHPDLYLTLEPPLGIYIFFVDRGRKSLDPLLRSGRPPVPMDTIVKMYGDLVRPVAASTPADAPAARPAPIAASTDSV